MTQATNEVNMLGTKPKPKRKPKPSAVVKLSLKLNKKLHQLESSPLSQETDLTELREKLATCRYQFKKEVRGDLSQARDTTDMKLFDIISNPSTVYRSLKATLRKASTTVRRMKVGEKLYEGQAVADGMYDSLSKMKAPNTPSSPTTQLHRRPTSTSSS